MVSEQFDPAMGARRASVRLAVAEESVGSMKEDHRSIQQSLEKIKQEIAKISKRLDLLPDHGGKRTKIPGKIDVDKKSDLSLDSYPELNPKSDPYLATKFSSNFESELINFPSFNGNNSDQWILHAEKYFELKCLNNDEQLQICANSFEGDALRWFRWENRRRPFRRWEDMKSVILRQFPSTVGCSWGKPILDLNQFPNPDSYVDPSPNSSHFLNLNPNSNLCLKPNSNSDPKIIPKPHSGLNLKLDPSSESKIAETFKEERCNDEDEAEKKGENAESKKDPDKGRVRFVDSRIEPQLPPPSTPSPAFSSSYLRPSSLEPLSPAYSPSVISLSLEGVKVKSVKRIQSNYEESEVLTKSVPVTLLWPKPKIMSLLWPKPIIGLNGSIKLPTFMCLTSVRVRSNDGHWKPRPQLLPQPSFPPPLLPPLPLPPPLPPPPPLISPTCGSVEWKNVKQKEDEGLREPFLKVYKEVIADQHAILRFVVVGIWFDDITSLENNDLTKRRAGGHNADDSFGIHGVYVEVVQGVHVSLNSIVGLSTSKRMKLGGVDGQKGLVLIDGGEIRKSVGNKMESGWENKKSIESINEGKSLENWLEQQWDSFFGKNAAAGVGDPDSPSSMEMVLCRSITLAKARRVSDSKLLKRQVRWRWGKALTRKRWMENAHQDPPPPPLPPPQLDVFEIKNLHRLFHFFPP